MRDYLCRRHCNGFMDRETTNMTQRKTTSLIEVCLNVASGFLISCLVWRFWICPFYGIAYHTADNVQITAIFTGISILRGYIWRRLFNR
jgi:RsiW-degrading membrane proteinase PrsW (M82 family)